MDAELQLELHREAVALWRTSLVRPLSSAERELFASVQGRLNPLLTHGSLMMPLGRKPNPYAMQGVR